MVRHPTSRRVPKHEEEATDPVVARVVQFGDWAKKNSRIVIGAAIVLAIVAIGTVYAIGRQASRNEAAAVALGQVQQTAASGNTALAIRDLDSFLDSYEGTRPADEGMLLLAQLLIRSGETGRAAAALADYDFKDPLLRATAGLLRGSALEEAGQLEGAEAAYLGVADGAPFDFQKREALEDGARVRSLQNDASGAAELYQRLVDMTTGDDLAAQRGIYEMRLAEAQAAAATGGAQATSAPAATPDTTRQPG